MLTNLKKTLKGDRTRLAAFIDQHIFLHKIKQEEVKCAFKTYRNPRVRLMVLFLMIQKVVTLIYLLM